MNGERLGQGRENSKQFLIDHPDVREQVDKALRAVLFAAKQQNSADAPADAPTTGK